ncbi:hypothetical protein D4R99_00425 [bacterium]|nr:MAG: hypothetical protein D4R99_00425 [bacterium]
MINNELLSFIKEQLAHGETKEQVTEMLVANGGWDHKDVDEAFDAIDMSGSSLPSLLNAIEKETEAQKAPVTQAATQKEEIKEPTFVPETPVPAVSPASPIDAEKIQFAEPTATPILTTAAMPPTPIPFVAPAPAPIQFVSTAPASEITSATPPPMEIPNATPQEVPEMTIVANPRISVAEPIASPQVNIKPAVVAPAPVEDIKIDQTLQDLRTRFMQGKVASPSAPATTITFPKTTPFVPEGKGLSPHTQSGMIPTERPASIPATPVIQTIKITPRGAQPVSVLSPSRGLGVLSSQQRLPASQPPQIKAPGRKLLGFFTLMTGMVLGAVIMHAYLNGYINMLITWIKTLI